MKLELKHLAGYLPYGLKVYRENKSIESDTFFIVGASKTCVFLQNSGLAVVDMERIKPILRPLSDLAKEIEVNGEKINFPKMFFPIDEFLMAFGYTSQGESESILEYSKIENLCFDIYFWQKLYEFHFDIHGLIEKGLAISIRDVEEAGI